MNGRVFIESVIRRVCACSEVSHLLRDRTMSADNLTHIYWRRTRVQLTTHQMRTKPFDLYQVLPCPPELTSWPSTVLEPTGLLLGSPSLRLGARVKENAHLQMRWETISAAPLSLVPLHTRPPQCARRPREWTRIHRKRVSTRVFDLTQLDWMQKHLK